MPCIYIKIEQLLPVDVFHSAKEHSKRHPRKPFACVIGLSGEAHGNPELSSQSMCHEIIGIAF
jgi:hypothetical protein